MSAQANKAKEIYRMLATDAYGRTVIVGRPCDQPGPHWLSMQRIASPEGGRWYDTYPVDGGACMTHESHLQIIRPAALSDVQCSGAMAAGPMSCFRPDRLAQLKLRHGLTTAALASLLGRPVSTVQHWLRGHMAPSPSSWPEDAVATLEQRPDAEQIAAARAAHPDRRGRRAS